MEIGDRVFVNTPATMIDGRLTRVDEHMVGVILSGHQYETELFIEEILINGR